jgi:hypothetical protein
MSAASFDNEPDAVECRRHIDRALGGLSTLHLGPMDYNVSSTIDDLLSAIRLLEKIKNEHCQ